MLPFELLREAKDKLHHSYLLLGDRQSSFDLLKDFFEKEMNIISKGNPDFIDYDFDSLGVDETRNIKEIHSDRPFSFAKRIFIIKTNSITREAQNSLLKILEEPKANNHFFFIIPSLSKVLPTLLSRVEIINLSRDTSMHDLAKSFIKCKIGKRLEIISDLVEDISNEKRTKTDAVSFLKEILLIKSKDNSQTPKNLDKIIQNISYLEDRSASTKMILEHSALMLE